MSALGELKLPKMDGTQVGPRTWLIGEPSPIAGTNLLRGLADVDGCLCLIEMKLTFLERHTERNSSDE